MEHLFRGPVEEALVTIRSPKPSSGCLLTDLGDLLLRLTVVCAELSNSLVSSELVRKTNTRAVIDDIQDRTDGSELGPIADYLNEKQRALE